jgi:RHS repeat-associated protein
VKVSRLAVAKPPNSFFLMTLTCRKTLRRARRNAFGVRFISSIIVIAYLFTFLISPLALRPSQAAASEPTRLVPPPAGTPPAPSSAVNRTVPAVLPPSAHVKFSFPPTDTEIEQARIFDERLVCIGEKPGPEENAALAKVLGTYAEASLAAGPFAKDAVDLKPIEDFVSNHPTSSWKVALLTNLGIEYYRRCAFTEALDAWRQAWGLGKRATDPAGSALVDRALAELARMEARLGLESDLQSLFAEAGSRQLHGAASTIYAEAKGGLWEMKTHPEQAFKCGPWALSSILSALRSDAKSQLIIRRFPSTDHGTSLAQVAALSRKVGLPTIMVHREGAATIPVAAVVHWKLGHFGALLKREGDRYLLQDPTFGNSQWVNGTVLARESSGHFLLVTAEPPPSGWRSVGEAEASTVWGRGYPSGYEPGGCSPLDPGIKEANQCNKRGHRAMAEWDVHLSEVSLNIKDTPVGYMPPIGPAKYFSVNYDQYEDNQPLTFSFSNLGYKWNCDWICTLTFDSNNAYVNYGGGGSETMTNFTSTSPTSSPAMLTHSTITRLPANIGFQQNYPDGSQSIFALADASGRYYLTQVVDPQGNAVKLTYDNQYRLVGITDSIGQVSTISYANSTDPFKITQVTDPFGRTAQFDYNGNGQLVQITDAQGMTSRFDYGSADFIQTLTTGYGSTRFSTDENGQDRTLMVTNPDGSQEMVKGIAQSDVIPASDPANTLPTGINIYNADLEFRNTFYWDRKAMLEAPGDFTKARIYQFLHGDNLVKGRVIETMKLPLENRVWYSYQGQQLPYVLNNGSGFGNPTQVARVLDDGTTRLYQYQYNASGNLQQTIDPLGRTTNLALDANGIDVRQISRVTGSDSSDVLTTFTYNSQHLPLTITDAAGQTTTLTYNPAGQVLSITDAKQRSTTFTYDASGYLRSMAGPLAGSTARTTFAYDNVGRVQTITDSLGFTRAFAYDNLDRVTSITYPDQTREQFQYALLAVATYTDRLNRVPHFAYDSMQRLVQVADPSDRTTQYAYCGCGAVSSLRDALGHTTYWDYDLEGRLAKKTYADGSSAQYTYEATASRLAAAVDSKGQITYYQYNADDTLAQVAYANALKPTPSVLFSYELHYPRVVSMIDGTGETDYSYIPVGTRPTLGAGRLATVKARFGQISYGYDETGQVGSRAIDGVTQAISYDNLNRISAVTNALGTFSYHYLADSRLTSSIDLPNGLSTRLTYFDAAKDSRLQQIQHLRADNSIISVWTYDYNAQGNIVQWTQQRDSNPPSVLTLSYDSVDQLKVVSATSPHPSYAYAYDATGNRVMEAAGTATTTASYSGLNSLGSVMPPAESDRAYEWDAANRLVAINYSDGSSRTEIGYDGLGRWTQITERTGTAVTSTKRFIWDGLDLAEELDTNGVVTKRFYVQGVQVAGTPPTGYVYFHDHEGNIREVTDAFGKAHAGYDYDPFGRITKVDGDLEFDFGFTGLYRHAPSGLDLAIFRAYDPNLGRWTRRDPITLPGRDTNLYSYVDGNPISLVDVFGLQTGITFWNPVGHGESSFGHVSTDINGTTYSFGPGGMNPPTPSVDFAARNAFRGGLELILDLTPSQESAIQACLGQPQGKHNFLFNNCGSPVQRCLKGVGIDTANQITPFALRDKLLGMEIVKSQRNYWGPPENLPAPLPGEPYWLWGISLYLHVLR